MSVIVSRALPDVRDGLKPVHRRVLYAMYDGGYRPDRGYFKCSRVVGDVMGPTTRTATHRSTTPSSVSRSPGRCATRWSTARATSARRATTPRPRCDTPSAGSRRSPWRCSVTSTRRPSTSSPTTTGAPRSRSSCRRGSPTCWSTAPRASRSAWRPTSRRTTCARSPKPSQWALENPEATDEELLEALIARVKGPDFPTGALIVGRRGIDDAYRTGRGSITMRAIVEVEEDAKGRQCLVVTALPYQVNPDNLALTHRRTRQGRQDHRHRRRPRRDLLAHRPAPGDRAQARCRRQGRAEQPLQAHPAADHVRRQHAGAGRRRADDAPPRPVRQATRWPTRSRSSSADPLPPAQGRGARPHPARPAQGHGPHRRGHRADPQVALRGTGASAA